MSLNPQLQFVGVRAFVVKRFPVASRAPFVFSNCRFLAEQLIFATSKLIATTTRSFAGSVRATSISKRLFRGLASTADAPYPVFLFRTDHHRHFPRISSRHWRAPLLLDNNNNNRVVRVSKRSNAFRNGPRRGFLLRGERAATKYRKSRVKVDARFMDAEGRMRGGEREKQRKEGSVLRVRRKGNKMVRQWEGGRERNGRRDRESTRERERETSMCCFYFLQLRDEIPRVGGWL